MFLSLILLYILLSLITCKSEIIWKPLNKKNDILQNYLNYSKTTTLDNPKINSTIPKLIVSTNSIEDGQTVDVSFENIDNPLIGDYIALTCGYFNDSTDFISKKLLNFSNDESMVLLSSHVTFEHLYMLRCNYTFTYYTYNNHLHEFMPLTSITIPMKESFNTPKQGHISFTSKTDEIVVMYVSNSKKIPKVMYGYHPDKLQYVEKGSWNTYDAKHMCHLPANITSQRYFRHPGYIHKVILHHLTHNTIYYYKYGNDEDFWSEIYTFRSRPSNLVKNIDRNVKFLAYADMGTEDAPAASNTASRVINEIILNGYDNFLLHFGDISYARGVGYIWDWFFSIIQPYATRIPYLASIGNHEYDYISGMEKDPSKPDQPNGFHPKWGNYRNDSGGECSVPAYYRFHVPENGNSIYWYSFDYGNVHVVQMSTEHSYMKNSVQYSWLKKDLMKVDRKITPWIVITGHRMMYSTQMNEQADYNVSLHFRDQVEDLLHMYKVDLMLVGHQHSYERSCPVYNGTCVDHKIGTVHIVVGSAGATLEQYDFSPKLGNWSLAHINE